VTVRSGLIWLRRGASGGLDEGAAWYTDTTCQWSFTNDTSDIGRYEGKHGTSGITNRTNVATFVLQG
jgi:phosphoribulokinase